MLNHTECHPSQSVFRVLVDAMSRPGTMHDFPSHAPTALPLPASLAAVIECLLDDSTSFTVIGRRKAPFSQGIRQHFGAKETTLESANFVLIDGPSANEHLLKAPIGDPAYPETGATLIYYVESSVDAPADIVLTGPGIDGARQITMSWLDARDLQTLSMINKQFPLGLDTVIVSAEGICAIPRSSAITLLTSETTQEAT